MRTLSLHRNLQDILMKEHGTLDSELWGLQAVQPGGYLSSDQVNKSFGKSY